MKNNFYKKLLSIILTAMLILATIPFSCISVLAENANATVLYASQISNNTHLTLNSDTELIMDKELYLKSITGDYNLTVTGSEPLNITNAGRTIEVNEFICSAPILVTSTSETYEEAAISVDYFEASGPELVLYGNYPLFSENVNITAKAVNIRALKYYGIDARGFIHITSETFVVNSVDTALQARKDIRLVATRYAEINSNSNGIETTSGFSYENAHVYLGGRITINAELNGIVTSNGSIYANPTYNISALEQLYITASTPININGIVDLKCPDAKITATGNDEPAIKGNSTYLGGVYDIKTNGGHGVFGRLATSHFYSGYFKISGPKGDYSAVKCIKLTIDEGLSVHTPQGATYDSEGIYDCNGNPAKEVEIYGIMDSMEIEMHKPVAGMKPVSDIRAIRGVLPLPSNCRLSEIKWYENDNRMTEDMVFTAGNTYSAEVVIYTTNYFRFPSGYMGKVNGKSVSTGLSNHNITIHLRPNFGTCPEAIEEVALNIAAPVDGKKPATAVTDSSSAYYVPANSVEWEVFSSQTQLYNPMSTTSTFIGGRHYKVSFVVVANSGYAFPAELVNSYEIDSCVTATVNGKPAYVYVIEEASTSKIRVSMDFGECNDTIIEHIRIEVTPPKAGEHPDYTARVLGTGYSINTSKNSYYDAYWAHQKWYYVKNGVSWWDVTNGGYEYVYDKDVFLPGHKYQCEVHVRRDGEYEFLNDTSTNPTTFPSVIVNGNPGYPTTEGSGLQFEQKVKYTFNCSMQSLSEVGVIELSQPLAGGTPDYIATTFAPHLYDIKSITWYDALGEELPANATFIAGMVYRVAVKIQPIEVQGKKAASFNSDTKASLNGNQLDMISYSNANKEDVEELFSHAYYENNQSIYLYYTFKPAPRPATGVTVSGMVISFGEESEKTTVQLFPSGSETPAFSVTLTGTHAMYSFTGVEAGTYTMKVSKANHVTREYTVVVGNSSVVQDVKNHLKGDINGDGKISAVDKKLIYSHIDSSKELTGYEFDVANVNGDTKISAVDKKMIYNHISGDSSLWE